MVAPVYTNFVPPAIDAGNLNEVNTVIYDLLGDGTNPPTNDSDIRTNIGLGTMATQNATAVAITGGTADGVAITGGTVSGLATDLAIADGGTGASTAAAARTNLNVPQIGPVFSAYRDTSNQALVDAVASEVVFNAEDIDTDGYFNTATGRFTPLVAGYYQVSACITMTGTGVSNKQITIHKNGVAYKRGDIEASAAVDQTCALTVAAVVFLNGTTDFVSIYAFIDVTGGAPVVSQGASATWFQGIFIRP